MVGERYGQSLDIGKEIEKEEQEKDQPLPCICDRKKPKAEISESEPEKTGEKQDDAPAQDEKPSDTPTEQEKQPEEEKIVQAENTASKSAEPDSEKQEAKEEIPAEKPAEEQPEEAPELPVRAPDPVEEDVNAIITKEIPELQGRKSVWANKWVVGMVFVAVIVGIFLLWPKNAPESAPAQFDTVSLVVYNITEPVQEAVVPLESSPVQENITAAAENPESVDDLPDFLAGQLRD